MYKACFAVSVEMGVTSVPLASDAKVSLDSSWSKYISGQARLWSIFPTTDGHCKVAATDRANLVSLGRGVLD